MTRHAAILALAALAACAGDDLAAGSLAVTIYGEAYVEDEIPAADTDGFAIRFDRFLVVLGEVSVTAGHDAAPALEQAAYRVFDLARPSQGGHPVTAAEVPGGHYDHAGYRIAPAAGATAGNASADDVALMTGEGYAVYAEGTATDGADTYTFAWGFAEPTTYGGCHTGADLDGGRATVQLTIHGDHLFYDDLVSSEPNVAFALIASADTGGDLDVSPAELAAFDITGETRYQTGSLEIDTLWGFIAAQVGTLGHLDGEGHCDQVTRR